MSMLLDLLTQCIDGQITNSQLLKQLNLSEGEITDYAQNILRKALRDEDAEAVDAAILLVSRLEADPSPLLSTLNNVFMKNMKMECIC